MSGDRPVVTCLADPVCALKEHPDAEVKNIERRRTDLRPHTAAGYAVLDGCLARRDRRRQNGDR